MADYDIYREQLSNKYPAYGHALWQPSPSNPNNPVGIGDVGFIRNGKFHRLFNALVSAEDQPNVPEHYEQLVPKFSDHISEDTLSSHHYCSDGISVEPESSVLDASPDGFEKVSFSNSRRRGAVLSLPVDARRKDTLAKGDFGEWIVNHVDHCFAFAQGLGLGIERMEELILVTGCDHTRSWTNVAFFGSQLDPQASFRVRVFHGPPVRIDWQRSPEPVRGAVVHRGPGGMNLSEDQCVFIRGFRVARTFWKLPKHLKAAAGPSSDEEGDDSEPDTEVVSIPAVSKYRDPLHILQDYIAEREPDCDMSLVHDDDLVDIGELVHGRDSSPETHGPEVMMDLLRKCNVRIHKVPHESSFSDSCPNTEKSVIKLAMLQMTSQIWNTASSGPSPSVREGNTPRMRVVSAPTSRHMQVASPSLRDQATSAISPFHHLPSVPCSMEAIQSPHLDERFFSEHVPLFNTSHDDQPQDNANNIYPYSHTPGHGGFRSIILGGLSFRPSFPPTPYTNPALSSGHPPFNRGGSHSMEAFPLDVTQATRQAIWGPIAEVGSMQRQARVLSPQGGSSGTSLIQTRVQRPPCPVLHCRSFFSRTQDQRRHLLTHLPHWIHCPLPGCFWRGDRLYAFERHWSNAHPSSIPVPDEGEYRTYDPQLLMRAISEGALSIQDAQKFAISVVKGRAVELRKPELSDNPWGSTLKRLKNSDPCQMVPTSSAEREQSDPVSSSTPPLTPA